MKRTTKTVLAATTAALAAFICQPSAQAQSADTLIDKLVEKGVLTTKEAQSLRDESDKDFTRAYQAKSGLPDWVTSVRFNGDLRLRYDNIHNADSVQVDRSRFRYRLRFGWTAALMDDWEVGIGLTSGQGDPISNNQSLSLNGDKKPITIDKVFAKWTPVNSADWLVSATAGKMENPLTFPSTMLFDRDYTPEGFALDGTYRFTEEQALKSTSVFFVLGEIAGTSKDPFLVGQQLRLDSKWSPKLSSSLGGGFFAIENAESLTSASVPNIASGNTRNGAGGSLNPITSLYLDGGVTYLLDEVPFYSGSFPVNFSADYLRNVAISRNNVGWSAGVNLGKAGKKGLWEMNYRFTDLKGDAWFEEFSESDFGAFYKAVPTGGVVGTDIGYRSGTNIRGHWIKGTYNFLDSLSVSVAYFMTDLINEPAVPGGGGYDSGSGRLFMEAVWKF